MKKIRIYSIISLMIISSFLLGHCQVPCGIYDDALRIHQIKEHISTIEKAMAQINSLSNGEQTSLKTNQLVRWINTKESHATLIQTIISDYFLTQRIKIKDTSTPDRENYINMTLTLQQMLVAAMKCKQTVDPANSQILRELTFAFSKLYFDEHGLEHLNALEHN